MHVIQLGPLLLNFALIIHLLSAFTGYLAIKHRALKLNAEKQLEKKFADAWLPGFLVWKFSPLLFDPVFVFQNPMSLLYFNGGERGVVLALIISFGYLWRRIRKEGTSIEQHLDLVGVGWIAYSSMYHLILLIADSTNGLFYILHLLMNAALAFCLYANRDPARTPIRKSRCWLWYSLGMIAIVFAQPDRTLLLAGFTKEQVLFAIVFMIALWVDIILDKKKRRETS